MHISKENYFQRINQTRSAGSLLGKTGFLLMVLMLIAIVIFINQ